MSRVRQQFVEASGQSDYRHVCGTPRLERRNLQSVHILDLGRDASGGIASKHFSISVRSQTGTLMSMINQIKIALFKATLSLAFAATVFCGGVSAQDTNINFGQPVAGIDIDPQGVLQIRIRDPRLANQRLQAAVQNRAADYMQTSKLRKVSLNRLESALHAQLAAGNVSDELRGLAGLTSVDYVFFYPETKDIVIAGPAEGFVADPADRLVGIRTGKPVVLLEDLTVAMRAYAPNSKPTGVISVSIDPTPEGLQQMQRFLGSIRGNVTRADTNQLARGLKQNLGLQKVTFHGVPTSTHFARVLVEADYRMKLIGIGLERLPLPMKSYVDRVNPQAVSANGLERWFFQPNYDGVSVSEDGLAMRIEERGVQLVGANERVNGGKRTATGRVNRASQAFCQEFTQKYPLIASRVRIYAELEQLIDVAIAAAYIQDQDFYGQADWVMPVLGDESTFAVETLQAPEQVETAVNAIWRGNTLMTPLGGGVNMQPRVALSDEHIKIDSQGVAVKAKTQAAPTDLADGQWWWD